MLNVSQAVKNAYANPSAAKTLVIYFPQLDITVDPNTVYSESFTLSEAVMDQKNIEFVGCIPTKMQVQIQNFGEDVKGKQVQVSVYTSDTSSEPVPLFDGIVDEVTQQSNKQIKELTAYDVLYTKGNTDIAKWYKDKFAGEWEHGVTIGTFRIALFNKLGISTVATTLCNDSLTFTKQFSPTNLKALDVIKFICQINGVFGIINRENKFEFRQLTPIASATPIEVAYYKEIDYQEFTVKPVDKLTIRESDSVAGVSVGSGENEYIVQGNFFTYKLDADDVQAAANNLYPLISGISYVPFKVTQVAYPWLECCDVVSYQVYDFEASQEQHEDIYTTMSFYIFERYIKGIQSFRDEYEAQGEEEQNIFITNINAQIQTIKQQIEDIQGQIDSIALTYQTFYNESDVDIADGQRGLVASVNFGVKTSGQVNIEMEWLMDCETTETIASNIITNTDLVATMLYEYDGVIIDSRSPKETYQDGKHVLHTYYILNADNSMIHTFKIYLNCVGGSVHIDSFQAQNSILGLALMDNTMWDGLINVSDTMSVFNITDLSAMSATDDVDIDRFTDALIDPIESVQPATIAGTTILNMTDHGGIDEYVTNAWVDETTATDMTYDTDYVEISEHSFVLKTEWQTVSSSVTIDSGYCTEVTPFVADITVEDVTVEMVE